MDKMYRKVREGVYEPVNYTPPAKIDSNRVRQIVERSSQRDAVVQDRSSESERIPATTNK